MFRGRAVALTVKVSLTLFACLYDLFARLLGFDRCRECETDHHASRESFKPQHAPQLLTNLPHQPYTASQLRSIWIETAAVIRHCPLESVAHLPKLQFYRSDHVN